MGKVKYGLKNVHHAPVTTSEGSITYGTPVKMPGAVKLSLSPKGDTTEFFADDTLYFTTTSNQGYDGTIELSILPDEFKKAYLGYKEDSNGVLFEDANSKTKPFALLFEFDGDEKQQRHVIYNVTSGRANVESETRDKSVNPQTDSISITAAPAEDTGYVKAKAQKGDSQYDAWFTKVYTFVEETTPAE